MVPVDVLIGGSSCQNFSIAGNRKSLDGDEYVVFLEQIRLTKEMRNATNGQYPRYELWENVPGALSSNKGEYFRRVLEELVRVKSPDAVVPRPEKGKWKPAGAIMGDNYSVAWRVIDARWFGVPQRRKRIALVADFGGRSAPEILFVEEGLRGNSEAFRDEREATTSDFETSSGATDGGF